MNGQYLRKRGMAYLYKLYSQTERANRAAILNIVDPRPGGRLLHCACGDGEFTARLACRARVSEAYGTECIDEQIKEATDRGIIVTRANINEPLPYKDAFFDIVHANQIIEHLLNPGLLLNEIRRVLRPDGYAILSTSNLASWHNVFSLALGMQSMSIRLSDQGRGASVLTPLRRKGHPRRGNSQPRMVSSQGLQKLCRRHGFGIERLTSAGYYPLPANLARLMCQMDGVHGTFLIAKVRPRS